MLQDLEKQELIQLVQTLEKENKELKDKLYGTSTKIEEKPKKEYITSREKVKLFMDIFKGRTDLYAKRWESNKIQRSGYSPVCKNEFHPYKCNKYKIRCNECEYRECLPLTEEVILKHLKGEITVGIYPLIPGDICYFLAIDFDKSTYQEDVQAFWSLCDEMSIPIYVERSRSGNGAHVWLFFQEATSAKVARKLGNILLTKTMEKASLDLDSYDRIFPNQDTMPNGGFGNLIALPFQGEAAKLHNTVFVNRQFEAEENQIEILKKIKKIRREEVYAVIDRYRDVDFEELKIEELGELEVPKREKRLEVAFQNNVECIIENQIYIRKSNLFPSELTHLKRLASFTNPKYYELQKLRMPIYNTPRIITCYEEDAKFLILPRGCIDKIKEICKQSHVKLCMQDRREEGKKQEFQFQGRLNKKQEKALKELLKQEIGVLCAATGFGKTVVGANLIAKLQTSTLVLVNRSSLLEQWKDRLSFFLGIEKKEIGQIGAGKDKPNHKIDVANFQTLYKKEKLEEILKEYGLVIVDECHHASSFSFEFVLSKIRAKHVYGLTAISTRKDGWHPIVYMQCGKIRYRVTNRPIKAK